MLRVFLKKNFWKNEIVSCVEAWIAVFDQQYLVCKVFKLCATLASDLKIGFHSDDISSHGPSKGVYQSPNFFFVFFVFDKVFVNMSRSIANMIRIEQIIW